MASDRNQHLTILSMILEFVLIIAGIVGVAAVTYQILEEERREGPVFCSSRVWSDQIEVVCPDD